MTNFYEQKNTNEKFDERPNAVKEIIAIKPSLFDLSEKSSITQYGFLVDSGWYSQIRDMVLELAELDLPADFHISQIKEKFSELKVHYYPLEFAEKPQVASIIERTRMKLESVCERCGKFAELRKDNGFYCVRCDACEAAILIAFIAMRPRPRF